MKIYKIGFGNELSCDKLWLGPAKKKKKNNNNNSNWAHGHAYENAEKLEKLQVRWWYCVERV